MWDELRRKVNDVQTSLPPGALTSIVNDDFGDVYGIFYAITGQGFTYPELHEFAKYLRKELLTVPNVSKVSLAGIQEQQIFVEIPHAKLSQLGISMHDVTRVIQSQNVVSPAGVVKVGDESIRITPTGSLNDVAAIHHILIQKSKSKAIYLGDIAKVTRGTIEVPKQVIQFNGQSALTLGIAHSSGSNVVKVGAAIDAKLKSLAPQIPAGLELMPIYHQPSLVAASVKGFVVSLVEAVAIVIVVLLIFMGLRSGLIIGSILLLTILGTFIVMKLFAIDLQRISLGALVITLGMLVDNAIVVAEGILIRMQ